jgi:hypothetical protein
LSVQQATTSSDLPGRIDIVTALHACDTPPTTLAFSWLHDVAAVSPGGVLVVNGAWIRQNPFI